MKEQHLTRTSLTIIGGGTMGTALAHLLGEKNYAIRLWVYEPELVESINERHENNLFLPGLALSTNITATNNLEEAVTGASHILSITPSQVLRRVWQQAGKFMSDNAVIVCGSKGIETATGMMMSEVYEEVLGASIRDRLAFLSGPSFAGEILAGYPTAVVVASRNLKLAEEVQQIVSTPTFRAYTTDDVVGVELGGSLKNVIAIAVGVAEGLGLGINSRSALITRGLAEITRLSTTCGGAPLTLAGLAGMGDLVLTCTGHQSRNLQVGIRLGKGETLADILAGSRMVAEGVATAESAAMLARSKNIEMPITETVVRILQGTLSPEEAVSSLMGRKLRSEKEH